MVIVAFELLAGMTGMVHQLQRWGARRPLLIADGRGTGPIPGDDDADVLLLEPSTTASMTEQVRARMRPTERLTAAVVAAVDAYDPDRTAAWWVSPVGLNEPMLGREVLSGRPPHQARLEDKLLVDGLIAAIGATPSASRVVPATYDDLMRATTDVIDETGEDQVVWAGDNREGINGGGDYVKWVRSPEHAARAAGFLGEHCDRARVSAFLDGVPCSIHGIVLPDSVVVLRPLELATLRDPVTATFVYAGLGTTWSPPEDDTESMRDLARRLGEHLRLEHGYAGAFGIDGVLTRDGFRVTELNTRFSGGLARLHRAAPDARLELVQVNALLGREIRRAGAEIEESALAQLDTGPFVDVVGLSSRPSVGQLGEVLVRAENGRFETARRGDDLVGTVLAGPSAFGSFYRFVPVDGTVEPGTRAASLGVLLHDFANRTWDAGFPPGQIAPDIRTASRG